MGFLGRKGMSPLIATVLLMAFAVALGGMIMNWSGDLGGKATLDCSTVALTLTQFCHDDQAINIQVRNTGDESIAGLALKIETPGSAPFSVALQDSTFPLLKGQTLTNRIPFLVTDNSTVSLIASLLNNDQPEACPTAYNTQKPLPKC